MNYVSPMWRFSDIYPWPGILLFNSLSKALLHHLLSVIICNIAEKLPRVMINTILWLWGKKSVLFLHFKFCLFSYAMNLFMSCVINYSNIYAILDTKSKFGFSIVKLWSTSYVHCTYTLNSFNQNILYTCISNPSVLIGSSTKKIAYDKLFMSERPGDI